MAGVSHWGWGQAATGQTTFTASDTALVREQTSGSYQPQFDGLRALAVLTVMADHFSADVPNFPLPDWIHIGATGVRLFLVLSGYFITASLQRARSRMELSRVSFGETIGAFYWRRFLRITPAYLVFAVIASVLGFGAIRQNWAWVFTGTINWMIAATNQWPTTIAHLWSICVQEQFYLFWPLLILLLPKRWMLPAIISVAIAGIAFRIGCVIFSAPLIARWVLPFGSLDSLAAGAALGWYGGRLRASRFGWVVAGACCAMVALAALLRAGDPGTFKSVLVEPLEAGAFVVLVARTAAGFDGYIGRFLTLPGLVFAGRISYGLYIYHALVALIFNRWLPESLRFVIAIPSLRLMVFGLATVLVASVSWCLIEQPINRLRARMTRLPLGRGTDSENVERRLERWHHEFPQEV